MFILYFIDEMVISTVLLYLVLTSNLMMRVNGGRYVLLFFNYQTNISLQDAFLSYMRQTRESFDV